MNKKLLIGIIVIAIVASAVAIGILRSGSSPEDDSQSAPTESDTEQVMDTVLGYLELVREEHSMDSFEWLDIAIRDYLYDYPNQLNLDYSTRSHLRIALTYTSSPVNVQYDFPKIQDNFASMKVYLDYPDIWDNPRENVFTFLLKIRTSDYKISGESVPEGGVGWRITDYYLSYTEVQSWEDDVR